MHYVRAYRFRIYPDANRQEEIDKRIARSHAQGDMASAVQLASKSRIEELRIR